MNTIVKTTSKGQITLPAIWRRRFNTNQYIINIKDSYLEVKPLNLDNIKRGNEYTVFDAIRDNNSHGMNVDDLVNILKKTL
ncbi:MAG: AbrB/MazE/SpoVT family DNA-binding domain-containing protein [Candidatus Falkowbacteria bacterium]|nr:AbrB/MazE/SpoVT family DNA-binding domain-containing protein [Candidatus Falkowbacteria bacterium]